MDSSRPGTRRPSRSSAPQIASATSRTISTIANVAVSCSNSGAAYRRLRISASISAPTMAATSTAPSTASANPHAESLACAAIASPIDHATYAPSIASEPCAKLTTRVTPKISVRPAATRKRLDADASPFSSWTASEAAVTRFPSSLGRSEPADGVVGRQVVLAVRVAPVDHHALAVAHGGLADVRAHRRLLVERTERDATEGRFDIQASKCA